MTAGRLSVNHKDQGQSLSVLPGFGGGDVSPGCSRVRLNGPHSCPVLAKRDLWNELSILQDPPVTTHCRRQHLVPHDWPADGDPLPKSTSPEPEFLGGPLQHPPVLKLQIGIGKKKASVPHRIPKEKGQRSQSNPFSVHASMWRADCSPTTSSSVGILFFIPMLFYPAGGDNSI